MSSQTNKFYHNNPFHQQDSVKTETLRKKSRYKLWTDSDSNAEIEKFIDEFNKKENINTKTFIVDDSRDIINKLKKELSHKDQEITNLNKKISNYEQEISKKDELISNLNNDIENFKFNFMNEVAEKLNSCDKKFNFQIKFLEKINTKLAEEPLKKEYKALKEENDYLNNTILQLENSIKNESENLDYIDKISKLEEIITNLETKNKELNKFLMLELKQKEQIENEMETFFEKYGIYFSEDEKLQPSHMVASFIIIRLVYTKNVLLKLLASNNIEEKIHFFTILSDLLKISNREYKIVITSFQTKD